MKRRKVRVRYFGYLGSVVGRHVDEFTLGNDTTLRDLLEVLAERYGRGFLDNILTPRQELRPTISVVLDGANAIDAGGLDAKLRSDGEVVLVSLIPSVGGGWLSTQSADRPSSV